jgi:Ca2+-binding EF-hand superfamily protein
MHWLDKDQDGILTREEMADVLQQVLKREITFEEAMEIAGEMVRFDLYYYDVVSALEN